MRLTKAIYQQGCKSAYERGLAEGQRLEREAAKKDVSARELLAKIALLEKASSFQEGITKLLLSVNNNL